MNKYNSKNMLQDVLKNAVYSILFIILTLFISIFYIVMDEQLLHYLTTDGEVIFITIVIIVELVLGILFIYLFKKTNKYKKLFFIIALIIFINLFSLIVIILPSILFSHIPFEDGIMYSALFIFTGIYLILLLSKLMYMYVFNKSAYFNKKLPGKNNLVYIALYIFVSFIFSFIIIYFLIIYMFV